MKAADVLSWICREAVHGVMLGIIDVPEYEDGIYLQTEEWWREHFGACPPHSIEAGKYLHYYKSDYDEITDSNGNIISPDAEIELPMEYSFDTIYLYKLED